jgi:hypothetical protein
MTLGHEWHETMSDQNPAGGWTNNTGSSYNGQENSDECAWISPGTTGGAANIAMGNGTYAEQASWSNDTNACAISHPIVSHGGSGGPGELISAQSGKCLDTNNQVFANGTKEQIWTCSGIAGQTWTLSGGKLTVDGGAYCLDAYNNGTANGTVVDLWSCNGGSNQQWTVNSNGTITGNQSGKCLDVTGKATANGTQVELWTCNGGSNQQWSW